MKFAITESTCARFSRGAICPPATSAVAQSENKDHNSRMFVRIAADAALPFMIRAGIWRELGAGSESRSERQAAKSSLIFFIRSASADCCSGRSDEKVPWPLQK